MKKLSFLLFFAMVAMAVSAQQVPVKWNVNAGIGVANWSGDDASGADAKFSYKVGVGMELPLADMWSLQTGLNLISKGVKASGDMEGYDADATVNQLYFELPVMAGVRIQTASGFDLLFKAGPYLAYGFSGKTKVEADGVEVSVDTFGSKGMDLKRFDAGLGFGIIFELEKIDVGLEVSRGLTKIASGAKAYNMVAQLTAAYKF